MILPLFLAILTLLAHRWITGLHLLLLCLSKGPDYCEWSLVILAHGGFGDFLTRRCTCYFFWILRIRIFYLLNLAVPSWVFGCFFTLRISFLTRVIKICRFLRNFLCVISYLTAILMITLALIEIITGITLGTVDLLIHFLFSLLLLLLALFLSRFVFAVVFIARCCILQNIWLAFVFLMILGEIGVVVWLWNGLLFEGGSC